MHDDDNLHRNSDAMLDVLRMVGGQVTEMLEAAKVLAVSRRDGRPLLDDLRSLARALTSLALGLRQTADEVETMLTSR